ncbi:hypothetical protein Pcinc_018429 [Petrolisthes cinctipes]|uniref:Uncharacterized protein n=1 Tax=Petrolisthes cinctipes TaxID=88211 RepID=A0AAE1FNK6_PETCI|nr:hypothetical protein Pcinc_018429 [Petrolisthes cinctipes]
MSAIIGVWVKMVMLWLLMLQPTTGTDTLVTDDCIVYHRLTFETFATSIPIHVAHSTRDTNPTLVVKYKGGNTQTITLHQLQYGKWTNGLLNLAAVSQFVPMDDDTNLDNYNNENNNTVNYAMVRSEVKLIGGLFYTHCTKATPNLMTDYYFYFQLPRTGHTKEEILLYPSEVDGKHNNITMQIGGEDWVLCKVNGEAVVRKVSKGQCAPIDEHLKLRLSFTGDKKMKVEVNGKNRVTVILTKDYESVFFKQLEPNLPLVYVQCAGTCPGSRGGKNIIPHVVQLKTTGLSWSPDVPVVPDILIKELSTTTSLSDELGSGSSSTLTVFLVIFILLSITLIVIIGHLQVSEWQNKNNNDNIQNPQLKLSVDQANNPERQVKASTRT